ncbi:MAG: hypothetical protein JO092_03665 [Candidatus Eremiobacteraeota bacterium]|nr:hypothetical protein [Candidatus Eremiobacteraeota bacterium]MBV8374926.1 hypothetical protein [Candidatus Eremiobacteraeota bacterium]
MKFRSMALVLLCAVAVLVACHGTSNYVPQDGMGLTDSMLPLDGHWPAGVPAAVTSQVCANIPFSKVPGKYIEMIATGNLSSSKFTGHGEWFLEDYKPGSPATPTPGATPKPGKVPAWLYYGSYTLKTSKQTGCAILITSKSGKPIITTNSGKFNGESAGIPVVHVKHWHIVTTTTFGLLSAMITLSSSTSGGGSATLTTETGQPYDTATITLVGRTLIKIKKVKV